MKEKKAEKPLGCIYDLGVHCALHSTYTAQEQKYIMRIDAFNQAGLREVIRQKALHGQLDPNKFEHVDGMRRLEIPYKALEPCKQHYDHLEKDLIDIGHQPVDIPYTETDPADCTQKILRYKHFDYLFRFVRSFSKGQKKYAILDIPFPTLQYYDSLDLGYHKVNLNVYFAFHTQAARSLYFLAEGRLRPGYIVYQPQEVMRLLTSHAQYRGIGNLCYKQLDDAEREIRNAYQLKMLNFYITHKIEYARNEIAGKYSELIVFNVRYRQEDTNEMSREVATELSRWRFCVKTQLVNHWKVTWKVADDLCDKITPGDCEAVRECFNRANKTISKGKMVNPAGYIVRSLAEVLNKK